MKFYYNGTDYLHRAYTEIYERVSRWIRIDYNANGEPYFRFRNKRYKLDNFLRCNSAWSSWNDKIHNDKGEEVTLAGYEADVYYKPFFVEISDCGEGVRVYQYLGTERSE